LRSASLVETLLDEASKGNTAVLLYVFDRRLGKPKATTELQGDAGAGLVVEFFKQLEARRQIQLEGGEDAIQE